MWTRGLARWYARHGRHDLPWRHTSDPWEVLMSEVMLQQTQVTRVLPKWHAFRTRWPAPADLALTSLEDVLRAWQGLGYPRRALALHRCAERVAVTGWPRDEAGLLALEGVGAYTARALLVLALGRPGRLPRDVNITRVVARAALGADPSACSGEALDAALHAGRPHSLSRRHYVYALFDAGALHCRSRPRCGDCPLERTCTARRHGTVRDAAPKRQRPYAGSAREVRGLVLSAVLAGAAAEPASLRLGSPRLAVFGGPAIESALDGLRRDGLLPATDVRAGDHPLRT